MNCGLFYLLNFIQTSCNPYTKEGREDAGPTEEQFYWLVCAGVVKDWCATCTTWCSRKSAAPMRRQGLQTISTGYTLQVVSGDIVGPLPETEDGSKYILEAVDCFTR